MDALTFDPCFDRKKIARIVRLIPATLREIERVASRVGIPVPPWPVVRCMTEKEIKAGKKRGKGHGLYYSGAAILKVNKTMPSRAVYLNLVHELFHFALPSLSDEEINDFYVPDTFERVTGERLKKSSWAKWRGTNPCSR